MSAPARNTLQRVNSSTEEEWLSGLSDDDEIVWSVSDLSASVISIPSVGPDGARGAESSLSDDEFIVLSRSGSPVPSHAARVPVAQSDAGSVATSDLASALSNLVVEDDSDEGSIRPITPASSTGSSRSRRRRRRNAGVSTSSSPSIPASPVLAPTSAPAHRVETPRPVVTAQTAPSPNTASPSKAQQKESKKVKKARKALKKAEATLAQLSTAAGQNGAIQKAQRKAEKKARKKAKKAQRLGTPKALAAAQDAAANASKRVATLNTPQGREKLLRELSQQAQDSLKAATRRLANSGIPAPAGSPSSQQAPSPSPPANARATTPIPSQNTANATPVPAASEVQSQPLYGEAVAYISSFLATPSQDVKGNSNLTLLKALIIELGLCPSITLPSSVQTFWALPNLPTTLKKARALIKDNIFLNVRDYLAVRERGLEALRKVMHPSRKALVKDLAKRKVPREEIKSAGLNVLMVAYCR